MATASPIRVSVILVTYHDRDDVSRGVQVLRRQLGPGDELVVVDNASTDGTADEVARVAPEAVLIRRATNDGFSAGCNAGAAAASGDVLLFLNPDTMAPDGFLDAIRRPLEEGRGWSAWMGLLTENGGRTINTAGNVIHFTGISWTGLTGETVDRAGGAREVAVVSGACFAVPREVWDADGGLPEDFFMYCEDVDLSLRLRLAGGRLGFEPAAQVDHVYEFDRGRVPKYRLLERNRWSAVLRTYPGPLLALVMPALLATEVALIAVSLSGGWAGDKLRADAETIARLPRTLAERRAIQGRRRIGSAEFASWLTPDLSSPYLGRASELAPLRALLRSYWAVVTRVLRLLPSRF